MYKVYKNLHNGKWSLMDVESGLVCGHADSVTLIDASTKISQAGRNRVLLERKKNVHAFIVGSVIALGGFTPFKGRSVNVKDCNIDFVWVDRLESITYNPYKYSDFVVKSTEQVVPATMKVVFMNQYVNAGW